jgi:hypothetical protein
MAAANGNGTKTINKVLGWVLGCGATIAVLFLGVLMSKLDTLSSRITTNEITLSGMREQIHQLQALGNDAHQQHTINEVRYSEIQARLTDLAESLKTLSQP